MVAGARAFAKNMLVYAVLAVQFVTVVPIPSVPFTVDERAVRNSAVLFPLIGGGLGAVLWGVLRLTRGPLSTPAASVLALAVYTLLTGALHLDGLMDTADAIGSRKPRVQALEVMRDSRVGAMGVVAAVLVMLGKYTAIRTLGANDVAAFVMVPALARLGMVIAMVMAPYARTGDGVGGRFAGKLSVSLPITASVVIFGVLFLWTSVQEFIAVSITTLFITGLFTLFMRRRFGGMTGDTYGALNELIEWGAWMVWIVASPVGK